MVKVGAVLLVLGAGALVGYVLYTVLRLLYTSENVPLVVQVAVPAVLLGLVLVVAAVIRDRIRARRREDLQEVEF